MRTNRVLSLVNSAFLAVASYAQAPQGFSYQAVARDTDGDAVAGQSIGVQFVLHQGTPLGAVVYAETHSATTNSNGLFALTVGGGSTGTGTFSNIDWSDGPYFMEVGMDVSSSGSYTGIGTQQLMSVPYALYAGKSNVPDGTEVGQILHWDGGAWVAEPGLYVKDKRFGIGDTDPTNPLGIKGEPGQDDKMISLTSADAAQKWNINLNPSPNDVAGFSIDDASSGTGSSRLFIAAETGNVGLGTTDPDAALTIRSSTPLKEHFQNGDVPTQSDFWNMIDSRGMSTGQGNPDSSHIHLTLQSLTGHLGLGTDDPPAPLSIRSRAILKTYFETGDVPTQDQFGLTLDGAGFGIGQGAADALTSRLFIASSTGNVGIGTEAPEAPLAVVSPTVLKTFFQTGDVPTQNDFGITTSETTGFGIAQGTPSSLTSRLFIQGSTGFVGIGTITPEQKLHIQESTPVDITGIKVQNMASTANLGWKFGHLQDAEARDGAFSIIEQGSVGTERLVVRSGGNVGINELIPDTRLHVSRDAADPGATLDLLAGTGIVTVGPMTGNIVADYRGIQARTGSFVGGSAAVSLAASELNLQRLGGDILIHGDATIAPDRRVVITDNGNMGLGKNPIERLDVNGAITIGDTETAVPANGTIRYHTGSGDLEGFVGNAWTSLGSNWEKVDNTGSIYYNTGTAPRVGIGTSTPNATLHVECEDPPSGSEVGALVGLIDSQLNIAEDRALLGLKVYSLSTSPGSAGSKNIGIYVSEVSGQSSNERNIAAVLNGNVVVGDITGQQIGTGGTNVLAIQNGVEPAASSGTPTNGVQLYSADQGVGGTAVLHVMTGDGSVMKLYRQAALTTADTSPIGPVYDPTTAALIQNMRERINQLETKLQNIGLLQ